MEGTELQIHTLQSKRSAHRLSKQYHTSEIPPPIAVAAPVVARTPALPPLPPFCLPLRAVPLASPNEVDADVFADAPSLLLFFTDEARGLSLDSEAKEAPTM